MKNVVAIIHLSAFCLWTAAAVAEPPRSSRITSDDEPAEGGVHLNGAESSESMLARAARMGASVVISSDEEVYDYAPAPVEDKPEIYTVKDGDTLWGISERFFGDAYVWPRIWSYNPTITNPNWIYPGDLLYLSAKKAEPETAMQSAAVPVDTAAMPTMPKDAVLMRSRGFVDTEALKKAGEVVGAHKEVMWLSQHDETYVEFPEESVKVGDKFAAYAVLQEVEPIEDPDTELGKLVEIKGLMRVISFDVKTKIARAVVEESITPIERGTLVGPVHRFIDMIPAVTNEKEVKGNIVAFLDIVTLAATHQVVFVDRGKEEGVKEGNRFFVVEQRDGLRRIDNEPDDREGYPTEVLAELRVVETRPHTATCLITSAIRELEVGQKVEMRKGY